MIFKDVVHSSAQFPDIKQEELMYSNLTTSSAKELDRVRVTMSLIPTRRLLRRKEVITLIQ